MERKGLSGIVKGNFHEKFGKVGCGKEKRNSSIKSKID